MKNLIYLALLVINVIALAPSKSFAIGADDGKLRTLRLALASTGEYTAYYGTKALALAGMVNTVTRVNGVFEKDFGVQLILVGNNDALIYTNPATDPYSDFSAKYNWTLENNNNLNSTIGASNYDIGHLFGGGTGNVGEAATGSVCMDLSKGRGYTCGYSGSYQGDNFDISFVAHELGHHLGAYHTFTYKTETGTGAQMEPGSGSTIMSYGGITVKDYQNHKDAYFHAVSIQQVTNYMKTLTCPAVLTTGNAVPVVNAGLDYTIPKGTPFMLTGSATDANTNDVLTYSWEQMDLGTAATSVPNALNTSGPLFRSYPASNSPVRYFPNITTILAGATTTPGLYIISEALPDVARTLNFRLTVRDNRAGGPANSSDDMIINVDGNSGPFTVDSQNSSVSYPVGSTQAVNWSVAGTNANGVNCASVDILMSKDGGQTFPIILASAVPNNGSASVVIPNLPGATNRIMVKGTNHIFFDVNNANFIIGSGSGGADTIAPTAPSLSSSGLTSSSVNLSWSGATDNVGVVGYDVYQNGVFKSSVSGTSLAVSGLSASSSYSFHVIAKDAAGNRSVASNLVNVTTLALADTIAPSAAVLSASGITASSVNLSWSGATDNVGVTGYDVYQNGSLKSSVSGTSLTVSGLSSSTAYSFYVIAKDAAGNRSVASNSVNVTTLAAAVSDLAVDLILPAAASKRTTIQFSASASSSAGINRVEFYVKGSLVCSDSASAYTCSWKAPGKAGTYSVEARAFDNAGNQKSSIKSLLVN